MDKGSPKKADLWRDLRGLARLWPTLRSRKKWVVGAAALVPLVAVLEVWLPLILRHAIDDGVMKGDAPTVIRSAVLYLVIVLALYLVRSTQILTAAYAVQQMIRDLRNRLIAHLLHLKASFHDRSLSGALTARATTDFDSLSESLNQGVLTSIVDIAVLVGCVIGIFVLNWRLGVGVLFVLPVLYVVVSKFSRALKDATLSVRKRVAALSAFSQECLVAEQTVKVLNSENRAIGKFSNLNNDYRDAQMKSVLLDSFMFAVLDGVASVTLGLTLWFAASAMMQESWITPGIVVAFVQYLQQLFEPIKNLGNKIAQLQSAFTAIDRIFETLGRRAFIGGERRLAAPISGDIVLRDVSFDYQRSPGATADLDAALQGPAAVDTGSKGRVVLRNINFRVAAGSSLALVGATGSGKSTIIKLLTKLYDGYEGSVALDGIEVADIKPTDLRQQVAIVPQDIVLFAGTIRFNINLGNPTISDEDVMRAARATGVDRFVHDLPGGFDFVVREHGSNLSHGQRQLIAFARALARNPRLLVLDEATSSVDRESEEAIQNAIDTVFAGRTVIVIAHRLSTVRKCDQIVVMNRGQVVESGTYDALLEAGGMFAQLHAALAHEGTLDGTARNGHENYAT